MRIYWKHLCTSVEVFLITGYKTIAVSSRVDNLVTAFCYFCVGLVGLLFCFEHHALPSLILCCMSCRYYRCVVSKRTFEDSSGDSPGEKC